MSSIAISGLFAKSATHTGWALTFPNVGWINTIMALSQIFGVSGFKQWHLAMTTLICLAWIVLFSFTVLAFYKGEIFLSGNEEIYADLSVGKQKPEERV